MLKGWKQEDMNEEYSIEYVDKPEDTAWGIIGRGLDQYNKAQAGEEGFQRVCFVLQAPDQEIAGGVLGEIYWGWLHVDLMWIREDLRGHGYGGRLLTSIEDEARRRGAKNVFLDTFSFQAPDFYIRHGYRVFGELPDFPPGSRRYFLTKAL